VVMFTDNLDYPAYDIVPDTSTYAFKALQRPTLIFDTYSYIHLINDPNEGISGADGNQGLNTDFEFEVDKYENDIFYMTGRFNKVKAIFKKASEKDKEGVKQGLMMQLPEEVQKKMANKYIKYTSGDGVEIALKVANNRSLYAFWFNDKTGKGEESEKYYNPEVDGSGDLFFPEPINAGPITITGLQFDSEKDAYTRFYTLQNTVIEANASYDPPSLPLTKIFGYAGDGKIFEALICTPNLTASLPNGNTKTALDLFIKFFSDFTILVNYDVHYYFTNPDGHTPELNIFFNPYGINLAELVLVEQTATYTFPIILSEENYLTFTTTEEVQMRGAAKEYYDKGYMKQLVDLFKKKTFKMEWSACQLSSGLIVQMTSQGSDGFTPPGILQQR
jgi:hypothetical protein